MALELHTYQILASYRAWNPFKSKVSFKSPLGDRFKFGRNGGEELGYQFLSLRVAYIPNLNLL